MRIGMLSELHPDMDHRQICQWLVRAELAGGLDVATAVGAGASPAPMSMAQGAR